MKTRLGEEENRAARKFTPKRITQKAGWSNIDAKSTLTAFILPLDLEVRPIFSPLPPFFSFCLSESPRTYVLQAVRCASRPAKTYFMVREGGASPEQIENQIELAKRKDVAERIRNVPEKFQLLESRVREALLKQLEGQGMAKKKELWILYDENRGTLRPELYSELGDAIQLKQHNGETISALKRDIKEIEELRTQLTEELRPSVYAELKKAPFVSSRSPEMRASWPRCQECGKRIKPQWRMIVRNDKEHPLKIEEISPYWNQGIALGQKTIPQEYRIIDNQELHQLEEHPDKSEAAIDEWRSFLSSD